MQRKGDHYKYIMVYMDDLLIVVKKPQEKIDGPHCFKLKGTRPVKWDVITFVTKTMSSVCWAKVIH